ncbi:DUF5694 domain-containing protein [Massilia sp. Mn16-1_5]|uniref:DUF5694 domain-containing protein n=1 Tax=Massilia sp. Mn16-1_5 TaxID=2079199 RepID=UPI001B348E42|nr:DUF5694 domain-containing protein [Massilia sp. Mn16-1_5]
MGNRRLPGRLAAACLVPLLALAFPCAAQVDLTSLDRDMAGPRAQVAVLGTVHLREMPDGFDPAALDKLIDKLAAFKPGIVTIENENGEECDLAARHAAKYGADYCPSVEAARKATGLDAPAAMREADKLLKAWPAQPTASQRRHLAALFLASYDRASAYTQWLQLPASERRAGDGLDAALVEQLGKLAVRKDETIMIAARLAARLGLPRVHAVDNHTGDLVDVPDIKAFVREIEAAWASGGGTFEEFKKREKALGMAPDLLPLYRAVNDPQSLRALAEANIVPSMRAKSKEGYPQIWVGGWEIRNLRMVANIRETFRERPGARVLTIVGASHKPWFDSWLGQLQGVDIVDVRKLLE